MKFGGVAVANGKKINAVADLIKRIREEGNKELVVVTSALFKVTDMLHENAIKIAKEGEIEHAKEFVAQIREIHVRVAAEAIADEQILDEVNAELKDRTGDLEKVMIGISLLGELSARSYDYIVSFGERLAAPIVTGTLRSKGIDAVHLSGGEAGIITNEEHGNAQPVPGAEDAIRARIIPLLTHGKVPVVTGYIGETEKGITTTLGRGGSDYTATLIGAAINADEIWLWKETEGIMSADPKIISEAKKIPYISYREAMELSYFGASILHPRAIEPVMDKNIPIRVKNLLKPDDEGTLIGKEPEHTEKVAKAITLIENTSIINIAGSGMKSISEVAAQVFIALAAENVDVIMISQGSSERTISIVIDGSQLNRAIDAIKKVNSSGTIIRDFTSNSNVSAVGVVGAGMAGTPGVAGKVFSALGNEGISIRMISQGSSEYNISFVVRREDAYRAARAIHEMFEMGNE